MNPAIAPGLSSALAERQRLSPRSETVDQCAVVFGASNDEGINGAVQSSRKHSNLEQALSGSVFGEERANLRCRR